MSCRRFFPSPRSAVLLLNAWFFLSGLAAVMLYWILSLAAVSWDGSSSSLASDIGRSTDVALLQKIAVSLIEAIAEERHRGQAFAAWGLGFTLLSSGLTLLVLWWWKPMAGAAPVEAPGEATSPSGFCSALWQGRLPLWKAFWLVYVPFPLLFSLGIGGLLSFIDTKNGIALVLLFVPLSIGLLWLAWLGASVLVWRCSDRVGRPLWGKVARVVVILAVTVPLLRAALAWLPLLGLGARH